MMHRMLIILLLAVISSIASAQQGLVEATWFEIETSNFHVFSQLSRAKTLQLAQKLETWRHAVAPFINSDEQLPPPPVPNNVYLFADEEGYREVVVGL